VAAPQITGALFGKPATLTMATQADGSVTTQIEGVIDAAAIGTYVPATLASRFEGSAAWTAKVTSGRGANELVIASDLKGLASSLPAPLAKPADEARPATFTLSGLGSEGEVSTLALGAIHGRFARGAEDKWNAALRFGAPVGAERLREGLWLYGELAALDVDAWRSIFALPPGGQAQPAQPAAVELTGFDLKLAKARYLGRDFANLHAALAREAGHWKGRLDGPNLAGEIDWSWENQGRLVARFDRLAITDTGSSASEKPKEPQTNLPTLDVTAQRFEFRGKLMGALDLKAQGAGDEWRIDRLDITNAHSKLGSSGVWRRTATGSLTTLNLKLEANDLNALFAQFGYGDYLRRGTGSLEGTLVWPGYPYEFVLGNLAGTFKVEARNGQFSKIQPGAGKILGLISLQSLPRRATFDFSDVFSEGFAFERIHGDVKIARGVLLTNNFEIAGGAAFVSLSGEVSMPQETQSITMRVVPEIGEGVALAAAVVGTPVLGLSTLLVSKLLNNPFGKVVAYEYQVTGSWDNPQVVRTSAPPPAKTAANPELPAARTQQQ